MSGDQFHMLLPGQALHDHAGRLRTVHTVPFEDEGLTHVVLRSGDLVRRVPDRFADDRMLLPDSHDRPASTS